jgi:phenylalanyl-tRNA synthetase beta subunit
MKVSLQWAQKVSNVDLLSLPKEEWLKKIGAQLGAVEDIEDRGAKYEGIVVAKVVSCDPHPNADKLHVCRIDDGGVTGGIERGDDNLVQVVCGAPNVTAGMTVAWIPPGATVPSTLGKDPFVLGARELRGLMSNGMLASPAELGISDDHDGILEILNTDVGEENMTPGTAFKKLYGLDDIVIDCENKMFTHRPDCFGILGVARELAGITHKSFKSPAWYMETPQFKTASDLPVEIEVKTDLVPRFMSVVLDNITVGKSPIPMQIELTKVGIRPINNVVDITNWLMHLTGQPSHAYDYDKIKARSGDAPKLVARMSSKGEKVNLLNGKTAELDDSTIVIATEKEVVGIAGVMGGSDTEVDEHTKRVIIEVASFDMYSVRRAAMKYGLFTDAGTRFTKGQSALQNDRVIAEIIRMMHELTSSTQASSVIDVMAASVKPAADVKATIEFINTRLGTQLTKADAEQLLANVECVEGHNVAGEIRSYLMGVGDIDDKLKRVGIKIVEKTESGHYKLIIPVGAETEYEKIVSWEMKPGYWNEYIGAKNVFLFKYRDTKVSRYEVSNDTEHEIVEMCRSFANDYYTSLEAMLEGNPWYKPLLPLKKQQLVDAADADEIRVSPPFWRTDLVYKEDLVEEVGRLHGYHNVPVVLPTRTSTPIAKPEVLEFSSRVRNILMRAGANELLTYSFVHGDMLKKVGQDASLAFHIRNALSPDLQYYRMSITPNLLDKVHMNTKAGYEHIALFELGKSHNKIDVVQKNDVPKEHSSLALVITNTKAPKGTHPFYEARSYVDFLANELGIDVAYMPIAEMPTFPVVQPFEQSRSAFVCVAGTTDILGIVGEYKTSVHGSFKLPTYTAGFELGIDELITASKTAKRQYASLAKYPKSQQDITLEVPAKISHGVLRSDIEKSLAILEKEHGYVWSLENGSLFTPEGSDKKRMSFRVTVHHPARTLTTDEVNKLLDEVSRRAVTSFAAVRV